MTVQAPAIPQSAVAPVAAVRAGSHRDMSRRRQVILQLVCLAIAATVLFPIVWIVAMSLDPRNISRPDSLFPPGASLEAYGKVWAKPTLNNISFFRLALNSIVIAVIISLASVSIGSMAAYAFSRLQFRGREFLMIAVLAVLMLPAVATIAPLFVQMNKLQIGTVNLRASLIGVALAVTAEPAAVRDLEHQGLSRHDPTRARGGGNASMGPADSRSFIRVILPLATPVLAVTAFFGFIAGWTEFYFSSVFLTGNADLTTLAMALNGMVGQYAGEHAVVAVRGVRGHGRPAGVGRVPVPPALHHLRPHGRRREGLITSTGGSRHEVWRARIASRRRGAVGAPGSRRSSLAVAARRLRVGLDARPDDGRQPARVRAQARRSRAPPTCPPIPPLVPPVTSTDQPGWWTNRVFYEVFVRSFSDSNGDGIGDLKGLTAGSTS